MTRKRHHHFALLEHFRKFRYILLWALARSTYNENIRQYKLATKVISTEIFKSFLTVWDDAKKNKTIVHGKENNVFILLFFQKPESFREVVLVIKRGI
jgi:hypothetical protein